MMIWDHYRLAIVMRSKITKILNEWTLIKDDRVLTLKGLIK